MEEREIAQRYIEFLSAGDTEKIIELFDSDGVVHSPVYGSVTAMDFYRKLADDTLSSEIKVKGIFKDERSQKLALYFNYRWVLSSGKHVDFDVVDILVFNADRKITELTIIYDTVKSRELVKELK